MGSGSVEDRLVVRKSFGSGRCDSGDRRLYASAINTEEVIGMSGTSALLADRMASLLPKTTAGACHPASAETVYKTVGVGYVCLYSGTYYYTCAGVREWTGWREVSCHY
jgi:hypothetical protein